MWGRSNLPRKSSTVLSERLDSQSKIPGSAPALGPALSDVLLTESQIKGTGNQGPTLGARLPRLLSYIGVR